MLSYCLSVLYSYCLSVSVSVTQSPAFFPFCFIQLLYNVNYNIFFTEIQVFSRRFFFSFDFGTVFGRLAVCGAELLLRTLPHIFDGSAKPEKQDGSLATYAKKIEKADCVLDFSMPAKKVHDLIRGLSPAPLASASLCGRMLKPVTSRLSDTVSGALPGTVVSADGKLTVVCGDGKCVDITEVLPAGKRRMPAADYLRGAKIKAGDRFDTVSGE